MIFHSEKAARDCQQALNNTMKMGNRISVFLDTQGVERAKLVDAFCSTTDPMMNKANMHLPAAVAAAAAAAAAATNSSGGGLSTSPSKPGMGVTSGENSPLQAKHLHQTSKTKNKH